MKLPRLPDWAARPVESARRRLRFAKPSFPPFRAWIRGRPLPFGLRIGLSAALLCGAALLTFIAASSASVFDSMCEEADFVLLAESRRLLAAFAEEPPDPASLEKTRYRAPLNATLSDIRVLAYLGDSGRWYTSDPKWEERWLQGRSRFPKERTVWRRFDPWRLHTEKSADRRQIVLAMDLFEIKDEIWRMTKGYLAALPLTLALVGAGAWWITKRSLEPVERLANAMESVALGDLEERILPTGIHDELGRLTSVFNRMMARLQTSFEQAGRFTSDASHELRTPITVLQGNLEALLQHTRDDRLADEIAGLLEQTERLRGIIEALLLLSKADAGRLGVEMEPLDLSTLTADSALDFAAAFDETGLHLTTRITPHLRILGNRLLLRQAIGNLLGNAIKFNLPRDGRVVLTLRSTPDPAFLEIRVANTGSPIPPEDRERIFARFYRSRDPLRAAETPGAGLGLSIVEAIVLAHHGTVACDYDSERGMNRLMIRFPVFPSS